jgi:hypothetical protein
LGFIEPGVEATRTAWAATSFEAGVRGGLASGGGFGAGSSKHLIGRQVCFGGVERVIFICNLATVGDCFDY